MRGKIFNSMVTMFIMSIIFCLSSCGIDKSKCTSDYVYYERVYNMYSEVFDKLDANQSPDADAILEKYACKELKNAVKEYIKYEGGNPFVSYMGLFQKDAKYSHDEGDPFIGTDEEIYNIANKGEKFNVPFRFCFDGTDVFEGRISATYKTNVVLIYEDGDWKVYNLIDHRNNNLQEYLKARKEIFPEHYR